MLEPFDDALPLFFSSSCYPSCWLSLTLENSLEDNMYGGTFTALPLRTQVMRFIPVLLVSFLFLAGALVITNGRMPNPKEVRPLPDILFELFPKVGAVEAVTDVIIFVLNVLTVFVMLKVYLIERASNGLPNVHVPLKFEWLTENVNKLLFTVLDSGLRPHDLKNCCTIGLVRFLITYTIVTFFRAFVIVMTSYPATDNHCQSPQHIDHPLLNMVLTLVTLGSGAIHCGDLMYSGHTIILALDCSMLWAYSPYVHRFAFRIAAPLLVLLSFYCIVASRSHYTDDILVSAYVTIATFMIVSHSPDGAPWQFQLLIRYWPSGCLGQNEEAEAEGVSVPVEVSVVETRETTGLSTKDTTAANEHEEEVKAAVAAA